jgi:uncharacterized protein
MDCGIYSGIAEALEHGFGEVADPDDLYHSPRWLAMDEEVKIARPFAAVSPAGGAAPRAGAWGLVVDDGAFWPFMRVDSVISTVLGERGIEHTASVDAVLRGLMPSAYLGALRGGTTRLQARQDLPAEQAREALGGVLRGVEDMARAQGLASVACLYVPGDDPLLRQVFDEHGYCCFGLAHHVSVLPVTTFDGYLARLSKGRRENFRRERRKIAQAGVQIAVELLSPELSEQMLPLEAQLYRKYGHESHPAEMARILHHRVIEEFGERAPVVTARADGVLRGYSAFILAGRALYSRDVGFDYAWQERLPLYFETNFYSGAELAVSLGARLIYYSYGTDEAKVLHGCDLLPRIGYVKALDEDVAAALRSIGFGINP